MPGLSKRVSALKPSVTVAVSNRAKQMKGEGIDVLSFAAGEPDFDTPQRIKDAATAALEQGQTKYVPTLGDPRTRAVIAEKLTVENNIPGLSPEHVGISAGGKHCLYGLAQCLFDPPEPGQPPMEAVLPTPAWVSYAPIVRLAGGEIREVRTTTDSGFKMSAAQLRDAINERTRLVILNSPSNPCGTMYSEQELRELAAVVGEFPDVLVLTDEIYEKIVFAGIPHFSIGSVPEIAERVITVNGLSKAYAMTGWRAGYAAMPGPFGAKLIKAMGTLQGQMTTNITSFVYPAIRVALTECADEVERMREAFGRRADLISRRLDELPALVTPKPEGAFYAFPDVSHYFGRQSPSGAVIDSSLALCETLLAEKQVAFVPGEDFGGCGPNHVRISFACSEEQIEAGMDRFAEFLNELS